MRNILYTIILCVVLAFFGSVVYFAIASRGDQKNYINMHWRYKVARHPAMRQLFNLHDDGDARSEYLGNNKKRIAIRIGLIEEAHMSDGVWDELAQDIQRTTGKDTAFEVVNRAVVDASADVVFDQLLPVKPEPTTAYVYVAVLNQSTDNPLTLGLTYHENGIILYNAALQQFAPDALSFNAYTISTALHEFGHQVGLQHNDHEGCLMTDHAETDHIAKANPKEIVSDFCDFEKDLIHTMVY